MNLIINGEERLFTFQQKSVTLLNLIEMLGHNPKLIVVEFNGVILPPQSWSQKEIKDGDSLEIVTIVGGGS